MKEATKSHRIHFQGYQQDKKRQAARMKTKTVTIFLCALLLALVVKEADCIDHGKRSRVNGTFMIILHR